MASGLEVSLGSVSLPEYWTSESGNAKVKVKASGNKVKGYSGYVSLYLSTDGELDGRSDFSVATQYIDSFKKSQTFDIPFNQYVEDPADPRDLALAPGRYYLIAAAVGGDAGFDQGTESAFQASDTKDVSAPNTDVLIDWVSTFITSTQLEGLKGNADGPYNGNRIAAMVSTAAYDIAAADPGAGRPLFTISGRLYDKKPTNLSAEAAVNAASYRILANEFPSQKQLFESQYKSSLAEIKGTISAKALLNSEAYGRRVADQIIASRSDDGTYDDTPFKLPADPSAFVWQPAATGGAAGALGGPNRGNVLPFILPGDSVSDYSATANQSKLFITGPDGDIDLRLDYRPDQNGGNRYAREYETARVYGVQQGTSRTQNARTPDQTEIGAFYSQDEADSWQPWGLPNYMAMALAVQRGNTLQENAQLFAAMHTAIADATTAAWYDKWTNLIPRPEQVIREYAHVAGKGVVYDPLWTSGLNSILPGQSSPPFPDYVSGHSDIYGAWSSVMDAYFGKNVPFSGASQTLEGAKRSYEGYNDPVTGKRWSSFREVAMEAAQSRLFWGVHTPAATGASFLTGQNIGNYLMTKTSEFFGRPLMNPDFDGLPGWSPFSPDYTANPILPLVNLGDPILLPPSGQNVA